LQKHNPQRRFQQTHPWLTFSVDLRQAPPSLWVLLGECQSKCEHLAGVPLRPDVAQILHRVYLAKGIQGTTAIEGNTLSEADVLKHIEGKLEVPPSKEYLKQEIDNILLECNRMLGLVASGQPLTLSLKRIKEINKAVLKGLTLEEGVAPGEIRTYSVGAMDYRGAPYEDCEFLISKLCDWINGPQFNPQAGLSKMHMEILKAILAHLYIEWIHCFGDGNGRTGRLVEFQILMAAGVPSPACHILSNHYNQTRNTYLAELSAASKSGGNVIPFISYALNGFAEGLRGQVAYVRSLQIDVTWRNYIHEEFRNSRTKAPHRQRNILLDIFDKEDGVQISEIPQLSPRLASDYAKVHKLTVYRDVDFLCDKNLLLRLGKKVTANRSLIEQFLPIRANTS
jgi:Fic family protein